MKALIKKIGSSSLVQSLIGAIFGIYVLLVYKTCKWQTINLDNFHKDSSALFVFWHSHLLMIPMLPRKAGVKKPLRAIVSNHRDGRLASSLLSFLKVSSINGSTGHGGAKAAVEAIKYITEGNSIVGMCPDGPRGPAHKLSMGALVIAKSAAAPIYNITYAVKHCKILNTWDKFIIPFPFSKGVMLVSEPFYIPKDANDEKLKELRIELEKIMNDDMLRANMLAQEMK